MGNNATEGPRGTKKEKSYKAILRAKLKEFSRANDGLKQPKKVYVREFLNAKGHHTTGTILASFNCGHNEYSGSFWGEMDLSISDCSRKIELSLPFSDLNNKKQTQNTINKLKLIRDSVDKLIERAEQYVEYAEKWDTYWKDKKLDIQANTCHSLYLGGTK